MEKVKKDSTFQRSDRKDTSPFARYQPFGKDDNFTYLKGSKKWS